MHIDEVRTMREIVKAFKVLSDETKLRMLNMLMERECCVCEVMQALEISQSKASRGLNALYDAAFLTMRKDGLWSLYSINREGISEYQSQIIEAIKKALRNNKISELDKERLKEAERVSARCIRTPGGTTVLVRGK
jgi:ArsR family transcriptional regulator